LSCLEGGGGLGSFWKAAAGKERLRSFLESWRHPLCRVLAGCECKSVLTLLWDSKLIPESTERRFESSVFELLAAEEEEEEEARL